jgi:O-antigen/teichoic acid export membrane protein
VKLAAPASRIGGEHATSSTPAEPAAAQAPPRASKDSARAIFGAAAVNVISVVLGLLTASVLARTLGPGGRGAYAAIQTLPMLLALVADLGLSSSILLEGSQRPKEAGTAFVTSQLATLLLFVPVGVASWIATPWLLESQEPSTIESARVFLLLYVPAMGAFTLASTAVQGMQSFRAWNWLRAAQMVLWTALLLAAAALGHQSARAYSLLYACSYLIVIPAVIFSLAKRSPPPWKFAPQVLRRMLPYAVSAWATVLPLQLSRRAPQLALAAFVSPATLGLYAAAVTISSIIGMFVGPVANVVAPRVASARSDEQPAIFGRFGRMSVIASIAFGAAAATAAPFAILILFGRSFAPAILPTWILIMAGTIECVARVLGDALMVLGRPSRVLRAELVGLAVMVAGLWLSLPAHPLVGTALTCLASRAAILAVTTEQCHSALGMSRRHFLLPSVSDLREFVVRGTGLVISLAMGPLRGRPRR